MGSFSDVRVGRLSSLREPDVIKGKAEDLRVIVNEFPNLDSLKRKGQRATDPRENPGTEAENLDPFESFENSTGQPTVTDLNVFER